MKSLIPKLASALAMLLASPSLLCAQDEAASLALLKNPAATLEQKQDACRNLALVGTARSVPALSALLGDAGMAHMARHALEPIPDPAVDTALRDALDTLNGASLIGVIGSIGVRGDEQAIPALAGLLTDPDPDVALAAARALGGIGTAEAAKSLQSNLKGTPPSRFQAISDGLFRCAESLAGMGRNEEAHAIYQHLQGIPKAPHQVRTAALRGAVLTKGNAGLPLLMAALRGNDDAMFFSAVRISMELEGPEATRAMAEELAKLPPERQILVIGALAQRGDTAGAPAVMMLLDTGGIPVRIAAVKALTRLAYAPLVPVLSKLSLMAEGELRAAARESLANFPDEAADTAITELLKSNDPKVRRLGTELIGRRRLDLAVPALLKVAATDREEAVCVAALQVLRDLAGIDELEALLQILLKTESEAVAQSVTHALVVVCARQPAVGNEPSPACVDPLVAALQKSSGPAKTALLEVLRRVGGQKAKEAVRAATGEREEGAGRLKDKDIGRIGPI